MAVGTRSERPKTSSPRKVTWVSEATATLVGPIKQAEALDNRRLGQEPLDSLAAVEVGLSLDLKSLTFLLRSMYFNFFIFKGGGGYYLNKK